MPGADQHTLRDRMLDRLEHATPGGPRWPDVKLTGVTAPPPVRKHDPLHSFDEAKAYDTGRKAWSAIFNTTLPIPFSIGQALNEKASEVRRALNRGERVVLIAEGKELAIFEPEPGAVLAACLRRDYAAAGRVTHAMLDAAQTFLPDVDREALRLTIEAALFQEKTR